MAVFPQTLRSETKAFQKVKEALQREIERCRLRMRTKKERK